MTGFAQGLNPRDQSESFLTPVSTIPTREIDSPSAGFQQQTPSLNTKNTFEKRDSINHRSLSRAPRCNSTQAGSLHPTSKYHLRLTHRH